MSASKQTAQVATVLAERNQAGVTMYMPNLHLFNPYFSRTGGGTYTSSSQAALAYDLLSCQRALAGSNDLANLNDLELHHKLSWLLAQPLFLPLLEGSFEDLCKTLRNDPSILQTAFPRTRGPQGALKIKMEMVQSSSSESSEALEEKETSPSEPSGALPLARPSSASPSAEGLASPPEEEILAAHQDARSPPNSSGNNKVIRTNWANFPLNSTSQSVLLTKFQVQSGAVSVPLGRAHSVLGAFSKSCTVTLQSAPSSSSTSAQHTWQCGYKLYQSQPTQVFLTKLKTFFAASSAKPGDILCLSEVSPGLCTAEIWHATSPQAVEFKSLLANGWSDVSPPLKNLVSPPNGTPKEKRAQQPKKQQRKAERGTAGDYDVENRGGEQDEGKKSDNDLVVEYSTGRRTRQAPRRFYIDNSSSDSGEDNEADDEYKLSGAAKRRAARKSGGNKRKCSNLSPAPPSGRPRKRQGAGEDQEQQHQLPGSVMYDAENDISFLYSLAQQHQGTPITNLTAAAASKNPSHRRGPTGDRLRRSPAKKPRKAHQTTHMYIDAVEGPNSLIMGVAAAAELLNSESPAARNQQKKKRQQRASKSISPPEANMNYSSYKTAGSLSGSGRGDGKAARGSGSGGRVRKPGGGYSFRSEAAYIKMRRAYRKGIPKRAPEGEPNMQAYYNALDLVDRISRNLCVAV